MPCSWCGLSWGNLGFCHYRAQEINKKKMEMNGIAGIDSRDQRNVGGA